LKLLSNAAVSTNAYLLSTVWAIVEARQTFPAVIVVASATAKDDTEPVARGLSDVSEEAGKRTAYLYLGQGSRRNPASDSHRYAELSISGPQSQRESFDARFDAWRTMYDVIIIELPRLASCELGAHAARLSDGIVVALYPNREACKEDRELTRLFGQLKASLIGVVRTRAAVGSAETPRSKRSLINSFFFPIKQH
jgi:hypothetical protein